LNAANLILLIHFGENKMTDKVVIHAVNGSDSRLIEYNDHVIGTISPEGVYQGTPLTGVANADGTITIMHNGEQIGTITTPNSASSTPIQPGDVITISPPPAPSSPIGGPVGDAMLYLLRALTGIFEGPPPEQPDNNTPVSGDIRGAIEKYLQDIGDLLLPAKANASGTPSSSGSGSGSGSGYGSGSGFDPLANSKYGDSQTFVRPPVRRDPLVLDLNDNGIETVGINTASPILFDQNADGVKTATGWISANDGFVVWDRNGNGTIDNGRELFGDSTIKSDGTLATNGFNALADLDSNHDGIVNAQDTNFASLRVWRDLNQDGISQSNELFTLDAYQITDINLSNTTVNTAQGNGNILTETGNYIHSGGATGLAGVINLTENPFYSQFTDALPLTEQILALPDMRGAGMVRGLRDAAARSPELASTLSRYAAVTSDIQKSMLDNLLSQWSATSTFTTTAARAATLTNGVSHTSITLEGIAAGTPAYAAFMDKLSLVEKINGRTFQELPADPSATLSYTILHEQQVLIEQSYQALKSSVYDNLLVQTRFKPYLDAITLELNADGISVDTSGINTALDTLSLTDAKSALLDMLELNRVEGQKLQSFGWSGVDIDRLIEYAGKVSLDPQLQTELNNWHIHIGSGTVTAVAGDVYVFGESGNDVLNGPSSGNDVISGAAGNDTINAGISNDTIYGGSGNDTITDSNGNDTIDGGAGDDVINDQGSGTNILRGGDGNDTVTFSGGANNTVEGGAGNDLIQVYASTQANYNYTNTFTGGAGNDRIQSGSSADTYLFNRGDGQDTISDYDYYNANKTDKLVFGTGIAASDLMVPFGR